MKNVELIMKNLAVRKGLVMLVFLLVAALPSFADDRHGRVQIGTGFLYERGMDLTIGYEYETNYHMHGNSSGMSI